MYSQLIHTPEFAAPLPRWLIGASFALCALLIAALSFVSTPASSHLPPADANPHPHSFSFQPA
jgi:hypothetical protein